METVYGGTAKLQSLLEIANGGKLTVLQALSVLIESKVLLTRNFKAAEDRIQRLRRRQSTMNDDNSKLRSELNTAGARMDRLELEVAMLNDNAARLQSQLDKANDEKANIQSALDTSCGTIEMLRRLMLDSFIYDHLSFVQLCELCVRVSTLRSRR
jgi:chromosome segregation ATPase